MISECLPEQISLRTRRLRSGGLGTTRRKTAWRPYVCVHMYVMETVLVKNVNASGGVAVNQTETVSRILCDLTQGYSFILQSVLGVLAFSTLICEWEAWTRLGVSEQNPFLSICSEAVQREGVGEASILDMVSCHGSTGSL